MTGDALIAEEPAQAGFVTQVEAPKPTNSKPANDKPATPEVEGNFETATETTGDAAGTVIALAARAEAAAVARPADGLVTLRPKPEKRKNAKERAKEKITKGGTTPMTAKAKSKVQDKVQDKASDKASDKAEKAKVKAQKADTKARKISAAKEAKAARAARAA